MTAAMRANIRNCHTSHRPLPSPPRRSRPEEQASRKRRSPSRRRCPGRTAPAFRSRGGGPAPPGRPARGAPSPGVMVRGVTTVVTARADLYSCAISHRMTATAATWVLTDPPALSLPNVLQDWTAVRLDLEAWPGSPFFGKGLREGSIAAATCARQSSGKSSDDAQS